MTGRGIDQVLPYPSDPRIYESYVRSAVDYVRLAEEVNGPIKRPGPFDYIWGEALAELDRRAPDARIINLETAVTTSNRPEPKGINYKMNPANIPAITAAGIDCCVLANNHVLDWERVGLLETLSTLEKANIAYAGAGRDAETAAAPAILTPPKGGRVLVFAFGSPSAGVPPQWAAAPEKPGVNLLSRPTREAAERISQTISTYAAPDDIVVVSIHWGGNWGYEIEDEHIEFAHRLIDASNVHIVHGHSSHHVKGIEVYRGKLVLYGCGDFINDYEGISGYEHFRDDLVLMYFAKVRKDDGALIISLDMVPLQIRKMRLGRPSTADIGWLARTLTREGGPLGTRVSIGAGDILRLEW